MDFAVAILFQEFSRTYPPLYELTKPNQFFIIITRLLKVQYLKKILALKSPAHGRLKYCAYY